MTMMNEKMTRVSALTAAIECEALSVEVREKLTAIRDQLVKQSKASATGEKKPTKTQTENIGYKDVILNLLADGTPRTIAEMIAESPALSALSSQRVNAVVKQLKDAGQVVRTVEKRKAYFSIPSDEVVGE